MSRLCSAAASLRKSAKCRLVFSHLRKQHFDGDRGARLYFMRLVDFAHAAGADHLVNFINPLRRVS